MFIEAGSRHHRPHVHAYYQGEVVIVAVDRIETLGGGLPRQQQRLATGRPPFKIEPLR